MLIKAKQNYKCVLETSRYSLISVCTDAKCARATVPLQLMEIYIKSPFPKEILDEYCRDLFYSTHTTLMNKDNVHIY